MSAEKLLSILMPVYNERAFLRRAVEKVMAAPLPGDLRREIVLVNDASTDGTEKLIAEIAARYSDTIRVFHQHVNQGKGAAIQRAIAEMRGDYAIIQDADLEYDPNDYGAVLRPLLEGRADVVYGSRFATREMRRVMFYHHKLGNLFLTHVSNFFTGMDLTDMETCYKAFRAEVLKTIPLRSNRFGMEPEITAKIAKRGCTVFEVPISYFGRGYADGKKIGWKDGFQALYTILKYWMLDDCFTDTTGRRHLRDFSTSRRATQNLVTRIAPFLQGTLGELDGGIGNISRRLPKKEHLTVAESDPECREILRNIFNDNDLVDVVDADATTPERLQALPAVDTLILTGISAGRIIAEPLLQNIKDKLRVSGRPAGKLVAEIPLYSPDGKKFRPAEIREHFRNAGYRILHQENFNFSARLIRRLVANPGKLSFKLADVLSLLFNPLETHLPLSGYSVIIVAEPA